MNALHEEANMNISIFIFEHVLNEKLLTPLFLREYLATFTCKKGEGVETCS